ncbi:MAG: pimeloyl-[acyl-carrier protein] methyl ester esterase [Betaproteobacteria bacterium RBG_16_56_24]|nr:MAG: pimeloyl-[acyl-carrier protein] methyl ester esterase [Betaproteobacteria bacterium RBG_16_56_24]
MAGLHVDSYEYSGTGSSGSPLLLIHGWAMHGGMWRTVAERLAQHFQVLAVDLPGHGESEALANADLDTVVDALSARFGEPLNICGWSLGGQVALRWAMRYPQQVQRLMLVASTPCFVRREEWKHAMSMDLLLEFGAALQQHYALTLKRFLALQVRGGGRERELLAAFRDILFSRGEPDLQALQSGLEILRTCDLRSALPFITQPALIVAGECDALAPMEASQYMAQQMPFAELVRIKDAAHVPFLSHADEFIKHLVRFMNERIK